MTESQIHHDGPGSMDPRGGGGPLRGVTVLEIGGIGPLPHFGMICVNFGADVIRIDRHPLPADSFVDPTSWVLHGRTSIGLDLKAAAGVDVVLRLAEHADVLVEGFRPGVAERLGIGPEDCCARNPRLIYGRMSGWGAWGPLAQRAGHDINYLALSGALHSMGPPDGPPMVPLNLIGDYGGGSMMLAAGIFAALVERASSGQGQMVEVCMSDGVLVLMSQHFADRPSGRWDRPRGENLLDGGAPFYNVYATRDHRFLAVGASEPQFYRRLLEGLEVDPRLSEEQFDKSTWAATHEPFASVFRRRTRDDWEAVFADRDACVTPVLTMEEAANHPHHLARSMFQKVDGYPQVNSAVRFSGTKRPGPAFPPDSTRALTAAGISESEIADLRALAVLA